MSVYFSLFGIKIYKVLFPSSPVKLGLSWAQQIFWLILVKYFFQLVLQCNSSDMDPASQGWDLPKLSGGRFGNPLPTVANYIPCSSFGIYGLIFFHILTLFKGLEDYGWPVGILIKVRGGEL